MQPTLFGGTTQRLDGLDRLEGLLCRSLTALFQPHSTASLSLGCWPQVSPPRCTAIPVCQKDTACHVPAHHPLVHIGRVYGSGRPIHTIRGSFGCLYMRTWTGRLYMSAPGHSAAFNASSSGMARISRPSCSLTRS